MNRVDFHDQRAYTMKKLLVQSASWATELSDEIRFFDKWGTEYHRIKEYNKLRGKKDRDRLGPLRIAEANRADYIKNRERNTRYSRAYRTAFMSDPVKRAKYNEYRRLVIGDRFKNDPLFKLKFRIRTRIGTALKRYDGKKKTGTTEYIGCTIDEYRKHIESLWLPGMSWDNYGLKGWHIDHKKPCAAFDFSNQDEIRKCFHYTNTQPLWATDNLSKGERVMRQSTFSFSQ